MEHPIRRRLLTAGATAALLAGGAFGVTATSQGESAAAGDPRARLFEKPMDLIVSEAELPALLRDLERNPAKYHGMDIGVDVKPASRGAIGAAMDTTKGKGNGR